MLKIKPLEPGYENQPVRVYRNLLNKTISVQAKAPPKYNWKVIGHITEATLKDVVFFVSAAGQSRAIREHTRNVHAWGQGILLPNQPAIATLPLFYNCFKSEHFHAHNEQGPIVYRARWLVVRNNQVFLSQDALKHPKDNWADEPQMAQLFVFPTLSTKLPRGQGADVSRLASIG
jgi:hypothetical protein